MEFVGKPITGSMLLNIHYKSIDHCSEVKSAIAYAQQGAYNVQLFEDCIHKGKKLTFYGRIDGTCPIDTKILSWFLSLKSPNATCRLVPHWLHAKVIWWVGAGVYIGSANLTDRAWNNNYEAGIFFTHDEIEENGLSLYLEEFFDGIEDTSIPLTQEEYEQQAQLEKKRHELLAKLEKLKEEFEDNHWSLRDRTNKISVLSTKTSANKFTDFKKEWNSTLQIIRDIGSRISMDINRPSWIDASVPHGVQADQFLHAYYYQRVRPLSGKDAYKDAYNSNKPNPEAAIRDAFAWWKSGEYEHEHEKFTIYDSSKLLRDLLSREHLPNLTERDWIEALTRVYSFGDHASKLSNTYLGIEEGQGAAAKGEALAKKLWQQHSNSGKYTSLQVINYVIWGKGEVAERIWNASTKSDWKLPHIKFSILGEIVGWARPTEYPPRNARTSKSLQALGHSSVSVDL